MLFDAIGNNKPHNEAEYGALSTMTAILGRLATYSGQMVSWETAFSSDRVLTTDAESWDAAAPVQPNPDGRIRWPFQASPGGLRSTPMHRRQFLAAAAVAATSTLPVRPLRPSRSPAGQPSRSAMGRTSACSGSLAERTWWIS